MKPSSVIDPQEYYLRKSLQAEGLTHQTNPHTRDTPRRLLKYLRHWTGNEECPFTPTCFANEHPRVDQMVHIAPISFWSCCSHHLLPFHGYAWVSYIPDNSLIGLSKVAQLVRWKAQRPQVQEHLTHEITFWLQDLLEPVGVGVHIRAHHTCQMLSVGPDAPQMKTTAFRGALKSSVAARAEFMEAIRCH